MKASAFLLLGLGLVASFFAGCHGGSSIPAGIAVALVDLKPIDSTLLESRATMTLRYTNESVVPFGMSGSRHKLYLNGSYVGTAVSDKPIGIPSLQTATQDVTLNLENLALVRSLIAAQQTQRISYRLESVLFQVVDEEKYQNRTETKGVLDLSALAGAAAR